jgi:endo-beta-N-acetylglucosaminidase D
LFINGAETKKMVLDEEFTLNKNPLLIGRTSSEEHVTEFGIQDLICYSKALTQEQVFTLYQQPFTQIYPPASGTQTNSFIDPIVTLIPPIKTESFPLQNLDLLAKWKPGTDPINICTVPLKHRKRTPKRRVIHCHDMRGGYQEDRFSQGSNQLYCYNFRYWQYIDIFIYFSHHCVTIPPPGWTESAHKNGVKVLGNFITEWGPGEIENLKLLDGPHADPRKDNTKLPMSTFYADLLVEMAIYYNFDGWFFNIEAKRKHI